MSSRMLRTVDDPVKVALCGRSLCFRALAQYIARAVAEANAPVEVVLERGCEGVAELPVAGYDAVVVCASECSGLDDPELLVASLRGFPESQVVVISPRAHASNLVAALEAGARGFVACGLDDIEDVIVALVGVLHDETVFSNEVSRLIVHALRKSGVGGLPGSATSPRGARLTERERAVLALLCDGLTNQQIARSLSVSPNTVKNHLARLYEKLGVSSRGEAISLAHRRDLV